MAAVAGALALPHKHISSGLSTPHSFLGIFKSFISSFEAIIIAAGALATSLAWNQAFLSYIAWKFPSPKDTRRKFQYNIGYAVSLTLAMLVLVLLAKSFTGKDSKLPVIASEYGF